MVSSINDRREKMKKSVKSLLIGIAITSISTGSEEDWGEISIFSGNWYLTNATIHYNYTTEE